MPASLIFPQRTLAEVNRKETFIVKTTFPSSLQKE
jgi:hypothetical protein